MPIEQLVPGDIVLLSAGDMIPADLRLISAKDLFVNQSALTGEAMPLEKVAAAHPGAAETPFDLANICFMGSAVVSGIGCGVVVLTGPRTAFGLVASAIAKQRVLTSFDKGINRFTWLMLGFIVVMVPLVFVINGLTKGNWLEALLVRGRRRGGPHARDAADDRDGQSGQGRAGDVAQQGHRQAPQRDPEFRRHGRAVHGQDRHADAGPHHSQAPPRYRRAASRTASSNTPISTAFTSPA